MRLFTAAVCAALLWILQGVVFHRFWNRGLSVSLAFDCHHKVEGERGTLKETITNAKLLPLPILHVKFQMGRELVFTSSGNYRITDHSYRSDIFSCMPWQEIRRSLEFDCKKRGYYTISEVWLVSYDLFFSGHFAASFPVRAALYVYPKFMDTDRLQLPFRNLMGQILADRALLLDPFEFQSVRPYQSYDPYRSVNWKATARTGDLKVNVYTPTASWQVMFLLDVEPDRIWKDEALTEEAIRLCGSYCHLLIKEGIPVSVCTNGTDCVTGQRGFLEAGAGADHMTAVMELLARTETEGEGRPSMEQIMEELTQARLAGSGAWDSLTYILISPRQRSSLALAYDNLCVLAPGSQWILPVRPGEAVRSGENSTEKSPSGGDSWAEEFRPERFCRFSLFTWEVPYDYSQTS